MSCKHGNHEDACDICDEVSAAYESGLAARLAAPSVANGAAELPALPESWATFVYHVESKSWKAVPSGEVGTDAYTKDQMQAYARAAIAALHKPVVAMTDELWGLIIAYADARQEYAVSTERHLAKRQRESVAIAKEELVAALAAHAGQGAKA